MIETNRAPLEAAGITLADVSGGQFEACYTAEAFLAAYQPRGLECLLVDVSMPGMNGLQLQQALNDRGVAVR